MTHQPDAAESAAAPYDAVLVLSFGGPERAEDVLPFLRQVTAGRGIPDERLRIVGQHYYDRGGRSPVNDLGRALAAALRDELGARGCPLPVALGNRNWEPWLVDALRELHDQGARRVVTVVTSAYSSYSSCRQYRENLADAVAALHAEGRDLAVDKVRVYATLPGFAGTMAELTADVVAGLPGERLGTTRVAHVTHSIPTPMQTGSGPVGDDEEGYVQQHLRVARLADEAVTARTGHEVPSALVCCSRSGAPGQPWLEPDVNDHLEQLAGEGSPTSSSPRSASCPTTWRWSTTWTPRRRPRPSGSGCACTGCRPWAPTRTSWRAWPTWCSSGPRRPGARRCRRRPSRVRPCGASALPDAAAGGRSAPPCAAADRSRGVRMGVMTDPLMPPPAPTCPPSNVSPSTSPAAAAGWSSTSGPTTSGSRPPRRAAPTSSP